MEVLVCYVHSWLVEFNMNDNLWQVHMQTHITLDKLAQNHMCKIWLHWYKRSCKMYTRPKLFFLRRKHGEIFSDTYIDHSHTFCYPLIWNICLHLWLLDSIKCRHVGTLHWTKHFNQRQTISWYYTFAL